MKKTKKLPAIGARILKSAAGVFLCYLVYILRGQQGIPFYSMLAVLQCVQPYTGKTLSKAVQRSTGTFVGAVFGLIVILLEIYTFNIYNTLAGYALTALMIIPVIYVTLLLHKQSAAYFSCVVFLSITVNHITDSNPYLFVLNRVLDTIIGIVIGILMNAVKLPRKKDKNTLFIAELDDMLTPYSEQLTPFSKVEINRMLDDGLKLTVATMRTPASLMKPLEDVRIKLPVIVMDGAALYDIKEKTYLKAYVISNETVAELRALFAENNLNCFINALCGDILIIYHGELENPAERKLYEDLRKSPYRNYIKREPNADDGIIYLMMLDESEKIKKFREKLSEKGYDDKLKILCYPSYDYPGYSYIKIFNKNACRENMRKYLQNDVQTERSVTVGARPESDIRVDDNVNSVVKALKSGFEPTVFSKNSKLHKQNTPLA